MTSYVIININRVPLYRGGFTDSRAAAEDLCSRSPELILQQIRFRAGEKWGQVVFEHTRDGYRQVSPPKFISKFDLKKLQASVVVSDE